MPDDTLIQPPENDGFSHETPKRAFTDWHEQGGIAVARGFRPSVQHLAVYLDALEQKEGWQLGQLFLSESGRPSAAWFRFIGPRVLTVDLDGTMSEEQAERLRDSYREHYSRPAAMWTDDPYRVLADMIERTPERERLVAKMPELGMPYGEGEEPLTQPDDPINPRHYGGTACAEIGELLTPNAYQTLKYCWRLGEKDDPVVELGKAIWYWKREIALYGERTLPVLNRPDFDLDSRIADRSGFTRNIARQLWYGFGFGMRPDHRRSILETLEEERFHHKDQDDVDHGYRGRGQQP